jgi:hypothetical protein
MHIYLSGAISNNPNYLAEFSAAAEWLRAQGHIVFNPCENDIKMNINPNDAKANGNMDVRKRILLADITWIAKYADAVYVLPNHKGSSGCALELSFARATNIPIKYLRKNYATSTTKKTTTQART